MIEICLNPIEATTSYKQTRLDLSLIKALQRNKAGKE